ncbi:hypothetical protein DAI22_03g247000 [Oryza sativa Japonica Group]|nr:hypothetical protein DAI22_03g247000 [Oryza sativa Japonica Group]
MVYSRPDPELPPSSQAQKLCSVEDPSKDCAAPLQEDVSAADLGANRNLSMKILHPQSKIVQIRRHYSTILKSDIQPHAARRLSVAERLNPPVWGRWATQPPSRSLVPRRDADVTTQGLNSRSSTTQVKEDQWSEVKPRFWWRKQQSFNPPNNQKPMHSRKQLFLKHVVGKCFRCLSLDHKVTTYREPLHCWMCRGFGHISSSCKSKNYKSQHPPLNPPPLSSTTTFPSLSVSNPSPSLHHSPTTAMARVPGDLAARPALISAWWPPLERLSDCVSFSLPARLSPGLKKGKGWRRAHLLMMCALHSASAALISKS